MHLDILAIEFNVNSDLFAVSFMQECGSGKMRVGTGELKDALSFIKCYKIKSERNQNADEAFY